MHYGEPQHLRGLIADASSWWGMQCHCYVCDKQAPCFEWGDGNQWGDHCHASDKDAKWIALRKLTKSLPPPQPRPPPPMSTVVTSTGLGSLWATSGDRSQTATTAAPVVPTFSGEKELNLLEILGGNYFFFNQRKPFFWTLLEFSEFFNGK